MTPFPVCPECSKLPAMIITIDGPAGAGKSTAARNLAKNLGIAYLDTGATYRAVTLKALREGVDLSDERAIARVAANIDLKLVPDDDGVKVYLDGMDVTDEIRSVDVTDKAKYVANSRAARSELVKLQREMGERLGSFVAEGRDQGSVVFPAADVKFYLDADLTERARRRAAELAARGRAASVDQVRRAMLTRDRLDMSRPTGPLVVPRGAITVITTGKSIEQVAAELLACVEAAK